MESIAILTCGALAQDVAEVVARCALPVEVHGVSAYHHLQPQNIVTDVAERLETLTQEFDRVVVLYGDCGTAGALDEVLARYPAARPAGLHCYEWYAGEDFQRLQSEQLGTYFLTDWLVAHWDLAVVRGLGLDRFPWLKDTYFRHITHLLYLQQQPDSALTDDAARIAEYLGVPLEIRHTGTDPIETVIRQLIDLPEEAQPIS